MAKRNWIQGAVKRPGSFTAAAKKRDETPAQLQKQVLSHKSQYSKRMVEKAQFRANVTKKK